MNGQHNSDRHHIRPYADLRRAPFAPALTKEGYDFFKRHIPLVESSLSPSISVADPILLVTHCPFSLSPRRVTSRKLEIGSEKGRRLAAFLIADPRLEMAVTHSKQTGGGISNRLETVDYPRSPLAHPARPWRRRFTNHHSLVTNHESRITSYERGKFASALRVASSCSPARKRG